MYNLKPSLRKKASKLYFDESQRTYDELHSMFYSQWRIINSVQMFNINLIYWMFWKYLKNIYPILQLANTEIPCRKSTKYRYHIYDRWRLLNVVSISRVCFFFNISSTYTPEINLSLREKTWEDLELIGTTMEKPDH